MKFKSALVTSISGSVGGMTGSHNRGGLYFRARSIPTDPNTPQQQAMRNAVALLSNHWIGTLTPAQRTAWEVYAQNVTLLNPFGDPIKVTGMNMYVRGNASRIQAAATRIDDGPTIFDVGEFTTPSFAIDTANDEVDVTFDNTDGWANETDSHMFVYASRPQNQTINFFRSPYRLAGSIDGDDTTAPTSPAALALPFPVVAGQRIFIRVAVSRVDGRLSNSFLGQADAA